MNTAGVGSESQEQQALFQWWALACRKFGVPEATMFAIPNGGARSVITGARLKREGVRAGIPDIFLAVPRGQWHGLFLELKRRGNQGRVSQTQRAVLATLKQAGYQVAVAHGVGEGVDIVTEYLEEGKRERVEKSEEEHTCPVCGKMFTPPCHKYCSGACRRQARRERNREYDRKRSAGRGGEL